jgi:chromosomal replication initiation ATPase DnaA
MTRPSTGNLVPTLKSPTRESALGQVLTQLVCFDFGVDPVDLAAPSRSIRKVARARQTAMYLAHTSLSLTLERAGKMFGRNRSTASHACHTVEDLRDEPGFDDQVAALESCLKQLTQFVVGGA